MFHALVETDVGDVLAVQLPDGRTGGNAVLSLLTGLTGYCADPEDADLSWFRGLDEQSSGSLCAMAEALMGSFYTGDWEYGEDEYDVFLRRSPEMPISEELFRTIVDQVRHKWTDLSSLLESARGLLGVLERTRPADSPWCQAESSLVDFSALVETLEYADERGGTKARLKFY